MEDHAVGVQAVDRIGGEAVPVSSPQKPAQGVLRFHSIAMMKVANSGALKIEKSVWM